MRKPTKRLPFGSAKNPQYSLVILAVYAISLMACQTGKYDIPFPAEESEFTQPATRAIRPPATTDIKWTTAPLGNVVSSKTVHFNFAKLPSRPFDIGASMQLADSFTAAAFDLDTVSAVPFDLSKLKTQKLRIKTRLLGQPGREKAAVARPVPEASRGVMQLTTSDGVSINANCFLQDKHGLFWIGTDKGIMRFDGENLITYSVDQGIVDPFIYSIYEDSKGKFWVGSQTGIFVIDWKAGVVQQVIPPLLRQSPIISIIEDDDGIVWASNVAEGVVLYNLAEETARVITEESGLAFAGAFRVFKDNRKRMWIASNSGLYLVNVHDGTIANLFGTGTPDDFVNDMAQDKNGRVWVSARSGISVIDTALKKLWQLPLDKLPGFDTAADPQGINSLTCDKEGNVWMGSARGRLYMLNKDKNQIRSFKIPTAINSFNLDLLETNDGQIWYSSISGGCFVVDPTNGLPANLTTRDGLGNNAVWSVLEDKHGLIWIGTRDGIDVYDPVKKTVRHLGRAQGLLNDLNTKLMLDSAGRIWTGGNQVGVCIIDIQKGTTRQLKSAGKDFSIAASDFLAADAEIWMGTSFATIEVINFRTNEVKTFAVDSVKKDNTNDRIASISKDSSGQIWIGCRQSGVYVVDKNREKLRHYSVANGLSGNAIAPIVIDSKNKAWIGSQKGLDIIDQEKNTITTFTASEGLASPDPWTINEWNGNFYVGTTKGLTVLTPTVSEKDGKQVWHTRSIGKGQGLLYTDFASNSSFIYNNQLWAGVENQILTIIDEPIFDSSISPVYITRINVLDKPQLFADEDATHDRLEAIDTLWKIERDSFYANKQLPADTGYLQKNNIEWDSITGPYQLPVNLRLPHKQNYLSFSFTGTHLHNADQARYRYILEGIDKNWSPVSDEPFSENYRDLPPGKYIFKVTSKGLNGVWGKPASISFTIASPWWRTWWAYIIYAIVFLTLLGFYIRLRSRSLQRENQLLEEKVMSRTNELRKSLNELRETQNQLVQSEKMASLGELTAGIAHEIQNPLNFVNNFSEINRDLITELLDEFEKGNAEEVKQIARDINENEGKIIFHGKRADAIVKSMLQHSRSSSGQKELTDINALCDEYLRLAFHGLRAKDKSFNASFETDFDEHAGKINIVSQDIGRVLLNLINNAFYVVNEKKKEDIPGYRPTVCVSTRGYNDKVEICVNDNGNGIPRQVLDKVFQPFFTTKPTGQGTGLGLSLSYDIVKAHGGEIKVETEDNIGSSFYVILPK